MKSKETIQKIRDLVSKSKSPLMDNSHLLNPDELTNLLIQLEADIIYDCKVIARNVRHKAIDIYYDTEDQRDVDVRIMNIQFDEVKP